MYIATASCVLRSDDTDARKATVRRFGRSDRSALRRVESARLFGLKVRR
jgi:hypothetical protein